jgi:crotonobetainyl-CoA:carnitine CoA-transferase CaiB-like acyl-CoA transferase
VENLDDLLAELVPRFASAKLGELLLAFEKFGVPCAPINDVERVLADDQVVARKMVRIIQHPSGIGVPQIISPIRFKLSPLEFRKAPPTLGEHTAAVLTEAGLDDRQIELLREQSVV